MTKLIWDGSKLEQLSTFFSETITTLTDYNVSIGTKITELGTHWKGKGYDALCSLYEELKKSMEDLVSELTTFNTNVVSIDKNGQTVYDMVKVALNLVGIVDVDFGTGVNVNATGDGEEIYGIKTKYDDASQAFRDAEQALLNLQADIDVLNAEYYDTLYNMNCLQLAYENDDISQNQYDAQMGEFSDHLKYVNDQLGKYKNAEAKLSELTANNDHFDLIGYFTDRDAVKDGKIREGSDGFFQWGKDLNLVNEGIGEAIESLSDLEPTSVICDTAAVNGLYAMGSTYLADSFSEGYGVSQTSMAAAYSVSNKSNDTLDAGDGVVFFNSKVYHESGRNTEGEVNVPSKYLPESTNAFLYMDSTRVFTQDRAYENWYGETPSYVDANTGNTYDSVRVIKNGETIYMTYPQYETYLSQGESSLENE